MKKLVFAVAIAAATVAPAHAANLIVNGGFEASNSQTSTPPGWTNIGHADGVISYAAFGTPAYDGLNYYDIGGFGAPTPAVNDGIMQTIATVIGQSYRLTFGRSGENTQGVSTVLGVTTGALVTSFTHVGTGAGVFNDPFSTTTIDFVATSAATAIKFQIFSSTQIGFNDPLIDAVSVEAVRNGGVPEPAAWAMMLAGFGLVGGAMRRRGTLATA
jgi:hypothetical protein